MPSIRTYVAKLHEVIGFAGESLTYTHTLSHFHSLTLSLTLSILLTLSHTQHTLLQTKNEKKIKQK